MTIDLPDQRTPAEADQVLAEAENQVVAQGGTVYEESRWDAAEMALDGVAKDIIARRLAKPASDEPYKPRGSWMTR